MDSLQSMNSSDYGLNLRSYPQQSSWVLTITQPRWYTDEFDVLPTCNILIKIGKQSSPNTSSKAYLYLTSSGTSVKIT
jgi:hypothetical protein